MRSLSSCARPDARRFNREKVTGARPDRRKLLKLLKAIGPGTRRSQLSPRLHRGPFTARRAPRSGRIQAIIDLLLPYVIFYEATEAELIIHAIRHSARDPSSMLGAHA
jgi:hypothetical protein